MKKIFLLICLVCLISGCVSKKSGKKEEKPTETVSLELTKKEKCQNKVTEYYENNNQKVYFVCLEEVRVNSKDTLSYYFNHVKQDFKDTIANLTSSLNLKDELNDGGTKIYKNDQATIIVCRNTFDTGYVNEDIYIGDENLAYNEDFCKRRY